MPKIDIASVAADRTRPYPARYAGAIAGREKQKLGDALGLTQFGVNITRIPAGSASALRHWHEQEDEFIYMLEGELVLQEDDGARVLKPGDAAGFKAGSRIGHCLINRTSGDAVYLDVGTRERVVGEPPADAEAVGADRREQVPAVGRAGGFHDAGNRAHREPRVAAADLAAALDEHDAEAAVAPLQVECQLAVPRFEDPQRHDRAGKRDATEGKHR